MIWTRPNGSTGPYIEVIKSKDDVFLRLFSSPLVAGKPGWRGAFRGMPRPGQVLFCSTFLDQQKSGTWFYRMYNKLHIKRQNLDPYMDPTSRATRNFFQNIIESCHIFGLLWGVVRPWP
jgi:hypothetical protein